MYQTARQYLRSFCSVHRAGSPSKGLKQGPVALVALIGNPTQSQQMLEIGWAAVPEKGGVLEGCDVSFWVTA